MIYPRVSRVSSVQICHVHVERLDWLKFVVHQERKHTSSSHILRVLDAQVCMCFQVEHF